jgi:hypothetical protein
MNKTIKLNSHKNNSYKMNSNSDKINTRRQSFKVIKKTQKNRKHVFSKENYNSGDGMLTSVWGPSMWHYLHIMSFNYPIHPSQQEKKHYREFVLNLKYVLPCKYCRINLTKNFKQLPLKVSDMASRDKFSRYIYNLHELVNKMLHKKSNLTFDEVRDRYEHFRSRCNSKIVEMKTEEKGCTDPLNGKKSKCIIKIVPQNDKGETFQMAKNM